MSLEKEIDEVYKSIGRRIRQERKKKKMCQTQLAKKLEKSLRTIQKYETGEIEITIRMLYKVADVFGCSVKYLIFGDKDYTDCLSASIYLTVSREIL